MAVVFLAAVTVELVEHEEGSADPPLADGEEYLY